MKVVKRILAGLLALILLALTLFIFGIVLMRTAISREILYPQTMEVRLVTDDYAFLQTASGFLWRIPRNDYIQGDFVSVLMADLAGTPNDIRDDTIIRVRFSGFHMP